MQHYFSEFCKVGDFVKAEKDFHKQIYWKNGSCHCQKLPKNELWLKGKIYFENTEKEKMWKTKLDLLKSVCNNEIPQLEKIAWSQKIELEIRPSFNIKWKC